MRWLHLMRQRWLRLDRRGGVAIVFAVLLVPLISCIALAVDFSFYIQARAQLNLAADAAAIHAVRLASQLYNGGTTSLADAEAAGVQSGRQWFAAQLGNTDAASISTQNIAVAVNYLPAPGGFASDVAYTGRIGNKLGAFITPSWPVTTRATAQFNNNYLEIIMMLDNSSSMLIGATDSDMLHMMQITPCYAPNALYPGKTAPALRVGPYTGYQCGAKGITYTGNIGCPVPVSPPYTVATLPVAPAVRSDYSGGPSCKGWLDADANGRYPTAGPPCAFACHEDGSKPPGQGTDLYALARSTIGTANPITLRFDLLKKATSQMLSKMASSAAISGNLLVGINTFNTVLTQVYPTRGEAGSDFTAAINAVGAPPSAPNQPDTGIQPDTFVTGGSHSDTNFPAAMDALAKIATASGNGRTAATPQKALILITDGLADYNNGGVISGVDITRCNRFKAMGYIVYVVYTPYYPLIWYWYYLNQAAVVEGTGPGSVTYNLKQCASGPDAFIAASDGPSLNAALQGILVSAQLAATRVIK